MRTVPPGPHAKNSLLDKSNLCRQDTPLDRAHAPDTCVDPFGKLRVGQMPLVIKCHSARNIVAAAPTSIDPSRQCGKWTRSTLRFAMRKSRSDLAPSENTSCEQNQLNCEQRCEGGAHSKFDANRALGWWRYEPPMRGGQRQYWCFAKATTSDDPGPQACSKTMAAPHPSPCCASYPPGHCGH